MTKETDQLVSKIRHLCCGLTEKKKKDLSPTFNFNINLEPHSSPGKVKTTTICQVRNEDMSKLLDKVLPPSYQCKKKIKVVTEKMKIYLRSDVRG